jgi:hypothetical protein
MLTDVEIDQLSLQRYGRMTQTASARLAWIDGAKYVRDVMANQAQPRCKNSAACGNGYIEGCPAHDPELLRLAESDTRCDGCKNGSGCTRPDGFGYTCGPPHAQVLLASNGAKLPTNDMIEAEYLRAVERGDNDFVCGAKWVRDWPAQHAQREEHVGNDEVAELFGLDEEPSLTSEPLTLAMPTRERVAILLFRIDRSDDSTWTDEEIMSLMSWEAMLSRADRFMRALFGQTTPP